MIPTIMVDNTNDQERESRMTLAVILLYPGIETLTHGRGIGRGLNVPSLFSRLVDLRYSNEKPGS